MSVLPPLTLPQERWDTTSRTSFAKIKARCRSRVDIDATEGPCHPEDLSATDSF